MKFITGTLVNPEVQKNVYQITAEFDDGPTLNILANDKQELEMLIRTYDTYKQNLRTDWNSYCNPDIDDVVDYLRTTCNEMGIQDDFDEDDFADLVYEYWAKSNRYDCRARFESCSVTYHDNNGLEFYVDIVRDNPKETCHA